MKDSLNRRLPYGMKQPTGKTVHLQERDLATFDALDRHGPLPSPYLYELTRHLGKDPTGHRKRLRDLFHETSYVDRPYRQWETINARSQFAVYDLAEAGRQTLLDWGYREPDEPHYKLSGNAHEYAHRFMTACVTASIELAARRNGHHFIGARDIWQRTRRPGQPFVLPVAVEYRGQTHDRGIMPDALFGIDYGAGARFFALEADRNNEAVFTSNIKNNTFYRKLLQYREILRRGTYKDHFGIPNLLVLTVTTNPSHLETIKLALKTLSTKEDGSYGSNPFLFKALPEFSSYLKVPPVMHHLYTEPWDRVGRDPFDLSKA